MTRPLSVTVRRLEVPATGPEDVVVDAHGDVWTGTEEGSLWRLDPASGSTTRVARTGGRPLGLEVLDEDHLLVCDAEQGLLTLRTSTGVLQRLVTEVDGHRMLACNNAAVTAAGDVWFTDSSTRHPMRQWRRDLGERTCTGRLLHRGADGSVEVRLTGLDFANGVALTPDGGSVLVAETGARRITRLWVTGERTGAHEVLVDDLPGYPDNLSRGSDGLLWVAIASPHDPAVDVVHRLPLTVRRVLTRLPERLGPRPRRSVRVQAYNDAGGLVHDLTGDAASYSVVTGVREHAGRVWLGSLEESAVAVVDVPTT